MAETLGTAILIFYGDGSVAQNFFLGTNFLEISLGWGAAVTVAILICGGKASPAIFNPAIAVSNAVSGRLRWSLLPIYLTIEVIGGFLGAALLLGVINTKLVNYTNIFDGGQFLVNTTGGIFIAGKGSTVGMACVDQIFSTALLVWSIMAVADGVLVRKPDKVIPILVGMVVYMTVGTYTANASSALNPARDLGPRILLLASCKSNPLNNPLIYPTGIANPFLSLDWGIDAFTIDNYYFWVPTLMPVAGALLGAVVYECLLGIHEPGAGGRPDEVRPDEEVHSDYVKQLSGALTL